MKRKWGFLPVFIVLFVMVFGMKPVRAEVESKELLIETDSATHKVVIAFKFVVDGKLAMCIEGDTPAPEEGDWTGEWIEVDNENMRKVLYYGYGGPENQGYSFVATTSAAQEANGKNEYDYGVRTLAEIVKMESPPANFRIWKVETGNGDTQDLVFYTTELSGGLTLKKRSADTSVTEHNPEYSLAGAVYGVYTDEECGSKVGELVTDEQGETNVLLLPEGTYYVKEITAPPGYQLDETCYETKVLVERTVTITVEDLPVIPENFVLPETGSGAMLFLEIIGYEFIVLGLMKRRI